MSVINSVELGRSIQNLERFFGCNGMWQRNLRLDMDSHETYIQARGDWCVVIYEYREMRKQLSRQRHAINDLTTMWTDAMAPRPVRLRCRRRLIPIVRRLIK